MVTKAAILACAQGLESAASILEVRANQDQGLPEGILGEAEKRIDIFMVELFLRRLHRGVLALSADPPSDKLPRFNTLARQACTAVILAREILITEGKSGEARALVSAYRTISSLQISEKTPLNHSKLERWLNFEFHEWEHTPQQASTSSK